MTPSARRLRSAGGVVACLLVLLGVSSPPRGVVEWEGATPASQQVDGRALDAVRDELARRRTKAFLVVRNGRLVYEWYAEGHDETKPHFAASMTKSLVGGTSLMLAMAEGWIHPDDPASRFIPAWRGDPQRDQITIRQLATHSSGMQDAHQEGILHAELTGWMGAFWKRELNPFPIALQRSPVLFPPGSEYHYSNPGMAALAYAVTASLQGSPYESIRALLAERVMKPLGIPDRDWQVGYGRTYELDGLALQPTWGGGEFTPRATARVGQWMLQRGSWNEIQLVAPRWVDAVVRDAGSPRPPRVKDRLPASGLGWWTNEDRVWPRVPGDAFGAAGARHQVLLVVPSLELVIVRNGGNLVRSGEGLELWSAIERFVFNPVMDALLDYSPSIGHRASAAHGG